MKLPPSSEEDGAQHERSMRCAVSGFA